MVCNLDTRSKFSISDTNVQMTKNCNREIINGQNVSGWLCTGDLGYYDDDGELFVVGRISDFILFRSINVSPAEIEAVLQTHSAVLQAAVIGMPHEIDEQHPMAIVSVVPGKTVGIAVTFNYIKYQASKTIFFTFILAGNIIFVKCLQVTEQELISLVENNMPDHCKLRAGIKFMDELPHTITGKIAKKELRKMFVN